MSSYLYQLRSRKLCKCLVQNIIEFKHNYSKLAPKPNPENGAKIIACKRNELDHYFGQTYNKLDDVPLASKGWNHNKAKGDYFVIHPNLEGWAEEPQIELDKIAIDPILIKCLKDQGISALTAFQERAISTIKTGKQAMLAAETGCGKTLAYLLPILQSLKGSNTQQLNSPRALVIVPSRELAIQIGDVAQPFVDALGLKSKVIVGGHTKMYIVNPEFSEIDLLVATPGALGKLVNTGR